MILRQGAPNRICIHHAAVNGIPADISALQKRLAGYEITHSKKDWANDIKTPGEYGYNFIEYHIAIAGNGHELRLQDDKYVLYHAGDNARGASSFNLHGIAVLIDGNYMVDMPNDLQKEALARIIARFEKQYKVDVIVRGHKETSLTGTSCPGVNIGTHDNGWMKIVIERANEIVKNNLSTNPLQDDIVTTPPVDPEIEKLRNDINILNGQLIKVTADYTASQAALKESVGLLGESNKLLKEEQEKNTRLSEELEAKKVDLEDAISQLRDYKNGRFVWLIDLLEKWFPRK